MALSRISRSCSSRIAAAGWGMGCCVRSLTTLTWLDPSSRLIIPATALVGSIWRVSVFYGQFPMNQSNRTEFQQSFDRTKSDNRSPYILATTLFTTNLMGSGSPHEACDFANSFQTTLLKLSISLEFIIMIRMLREQFCAVGHSPHADIARITHPGENVSHVCLRLRGDPETLAWQIVRSVCMHDL